MKKFITILLMITFSLTCSAQKGKWKKAQKENSIESYQNFLTKYPESEFYEDAILKLIELEYQNAREINSISYYSKFLKTYKDNDNIYLEKAKTDLMILEFNKAKESGNINDYKRFIQKYPDSKYVPQTRISIDSLDYLSAERVNTWSKYIEYINNYGVDGKYYNIAREKAEAELNSEIKQAATISLCEEYLEYFPDNENQQEINTTLIDLYFEESSELHDDRKYKDVVSYLGKIINLDDKNIRALSWRANIKDHNKNYREAIEDYEKVIKYTDNDTTYATSYYQIANSLFELGEKEESLSRINELVRHKPGFSRSYYYRAAIKQVLENKSGAIADYTKAIQLDNKYVNAYGNRGYVRSQLGDNKGAIQDYRKVIDIEPRFWFISEITDKYGKEIFNKKESYTGTIVSKSQSFSASLSGATPGGITYWTEEHKDIGFYIDQKKSIKWGLMTIDEENPGFLKFVSKGWKVQFTTTNAIRTRGSGDDNSITKEVIYFRRFK